MPTIAQRVKHIIGDAFGAAIVEQTIEKAIQDARERASEPQTTFYDPMSLFMGREWMTKGQGTLTPVDLRAMANNPIIGSIIQTRLNQVAAFCTPRTQDYQLGFEIKTEDNEAKRDIAKTIAIRDWIFSMGITGYGDPLLETFARKFIRDSLILDQACAEIVNRRNGTPAYVVAVDAAYIKRLRASLDYATPPRSGEPWYAQVMDDQVITTYTPEQMIFGVRNPLTDIGAAGYGMSELELLIRTITTMLNSEKFNSGQLTQGGTAKGILVVKGDIDKDQFDVFKRDFREAVRNAAHHWRPPVLRVSKDAEVDWKTLDRSNRDMEYAQLFDFLVKQACGVYQIDPSEINWQIGQTGASVTFSSDQPQKQQASKSRGLRPLLTFLANQLTINLIQRIDPRYRVEFLGLDEDRATDAEITTKETSTTKTVNEARAEKGRPPLPGGDIILNQFYVQAMQGMELGGQTGNGNPAHQGDPQDDDPNNRDVDITQELEQ